MIANIVLTAEMENFIRRDYDWEACPETMIAYNARIINPDTSFSLYSIWDPTDDEPTFLAKDQMLSVSEPPKVYLDLYLASL